MKDIVEHARIFATAAHAAVSQVRKYSFEPYINHPAAVVDTLRGIGAPDHVLAAAWLHDVVEDTGVPLALIHKEFGPGVAYLVGGMTDISTPEMGNRAERKALDRAHTAAQCADCKTIKLADLIDNTASIVERDPKFATVYLAEKALLLGVLKDGNRELWDRAAHQAGAI
jgi:(p)ppGpp synthase/HD superfamily hydrolase